MEAISVALDWTPNTNHTGFYIAKAKGFYKEAGLDVSMLSPHVDDYKTTPASRVADGTATFAVCPSESVVSFHTHPEGQKPKIRGVAALLADSTSAVVTLESSGIDRPSKLDGKVYASYGARYEGRIVQQMIINDGGKGTYTESTPAMLGIWNTLLKGEADATWVFLGWEGVEAELKGIKLNTFKLEDSKVAYGYSPLLVAHPDTISSKAATIKKFLAATALGYKFAVSNAEEAAKVFLQAVKDEHSAHPLPEQLDEKMVIASHAYTATHFLNKDGQWGHQDVNVWDKFLDWLSSSGLLTTKVQSRGPASAATTSLDGLRQGDAGEVVPRDSVKAAELFTNEFL